ncbi:hypothetical protein PVL29_014660 [Vitis rotundifolia]|uniref:Prolamin-like domain-containing protein n=1 Tax=Vitis rotundifolia TaxID=103349 RepID=A0AA38ZHE2_VITRO|nr:hypothetical protein PVL29_014660 [Vitis rotundifolia]
MASFGNVYTMGLILLASVAVMALGEVIEDDVGFIPTASPGPSGIEYDAPDTDPGTQSILPFYQYLKACVQKVPTGCGQQIFSYLFKDGPAIASHCCEQLGSVGIDCHESLTLYLVGIPEFSGKEDQIISKARELIQKCLPQKNQFAPPPSI